MNEAHLNYCCNYPIGAVTPTGAWRGSAHPDHGPHGGGTRSRWDRHHDTDEARAVRLAPGTHSLNLR
jgi:hypothetical protein